MTSSDRRAYIDWARGIAVLLMIEAHTIDAWTRLADRETLACRWGTMLGGFAAPMFLWLAGLGVVMSATRTAERTGSRLAAVRGISARGLEIFLLAFLFRLQAFVVSPGSHPVTMFRVDVLNIMGPAIVAAGLVYALRVRTPGRVAIYAALAAAVAMVTPIVRAAAWVGYLPLWLQWYIRPAAEYTTFTLFPWAGFVFAGAAAGVLIAAARDAEIDRRLHLALAVVGTALIALGYYASARPTIYRAPSMFWTSSPTFFALRVGILMVALAVLAWMSDASATAQNPNSRLRVFAPLRVFVPLATLGRASLFIYWIHVELVYGYASWLWRHRLPFWAWVMAYVAFCALMYRTIGWRDTWRQTWRQRSMNATAPVRTSL